MSAPSVSILMPVLNAERYVADAVRSVLQCSSESSLEVVVIDDGSQDDSTAAVQAIGDDRVRVVPGPGTGIAMAFNAGLAVARGSMLARCDGDDLFVPGRLDRQAKWLEAHPEFGAVCGGFDTITEKGRFIRHMDCGAQAEEITAELRDGLARTSFCTWLVRTELVRQIQGCREFFKVGEDIDLQFRLGECSRVWFDPACTYRYRLHDGSTTHRNTRGIRTFFTESARRMQQDRLAGRLDDLQRGQPPAIPAFDRDVVDHAALHTQRMLIGAAWTHHEQGRRGQAIRTAWRACMAHPTNFNAWINLGSLAFRGQQS